MVLFDVLQRKPGSNLGTFIKLNLSRRPVTNSFRDQTRDAQSNRVFNTSIERSQKEKKRKEQKNTHTHTHKGRGTYGGGDAAGDDGVALGPGLRLVVGEEFAADPDGDADDHGRHGDAGQQADAHRRPHQRPQLPQDLLLARPRLLAPERAPRRTIQKANRNKNKKKKRNKNQNKTESIKIASSRRSRDESTSQTHQITHFDVTSNVINSKSITVNSVNMCQFIIPGKSDFYNISSWPIV